MIAKSKDFVTFANIISNPRLLTKKIKYMKKLSITLLLAVMLVGLSSCDTRHFWSALSGYHWYAIEGVDGYSRFPIYTTDYDYMEIYFSTDGTGTVKFYDDYGYWGSYGFEWDEYRDYVTLYYFAGGHDTYYFDTKGGYLYLSRNPYMNSYTVFAH